MLSREEKLDRRFNHGLIACKKIKDSFFGGAEKEAGRKNRAELAKGRRAVEAAAAQARGDAIPLFGGAQESQRLGFQSALDVFGQSVPEQARLFGAGNVGAQEQLIAGLPQIQRALLGQNVDLNRFQPVQLTPDLDFAQQTLPTTPTIAELLNPAPAEVAPAPPFRIGIR